jgi:FkbM family methyltransferase
VNFDNPAWRSAPLRTGARVATSLARRAVPRFSKIPVPYDEGRCAIMADLHTAMGLELYRYGRRDPDIELLGRLLSPGDVFVDGGANVGLFTLVAAQRVGPSGKVLAFEPGRAVRLQLMENVVLNGFSHVEVVPFALAAAAGEASFRAFELGGAGLNHLGPTEGEGGSVETVKLAALDEVLLPSDRARLTVVKLDLEGAEHSALLGASATLRQARPDILIEIEAPHLERMASSVSQVSALLRQHGYTFFRPDGDPSGLPVLTPIADLEAPAPRPNVFATTDPSRGRSRGIRFNDA